MTFLVWALSGRSKQMVKLALDLGADPNLTLEGGESAISLSAAAPDPDMLALLLDHGGNPNAMDNQGAPCLFHAVKAGFWKNAELLLAHGADITAVDTVRQNLLINLATVNQFEAIERMMERGIPLDAKDQFGNDLAWYVEDSRVSVESRQGQARERVKALLAAKGIHLAPAQR